MPGINTTADNIIETTFEKFNQTIDEDWNENDFKKNINNTSTNDSQEMKNKIISDNISMMIVLVLVVSIILYRFCKRFGTG